MGGSDFFKESLHHPYPVIKVGIKLYSQIFKKNSEFEMVNS